MSNNAAAGQETAVEEVVRSTAWAEWYDSRENQLFLVYLICTFIGVSCLCIVLSYFGDKGDYQEVLRREARRNKGGGGPCAYCCGSAGNRQRRASDNDDDMDDVIIRY